MVTLVNADPKNLPKTMGFCERLINEMGSLIRGSFVAKNRILFLKRENVMEIAVIFPFCRTKFYGNVRCFIWITTLCIVFTSSEYHSEIIYEMNLFKSKLYGQSVFKYLLCNLRTECGIEYVSLPNFRRKNNGSHKTDDFKTHGKKNRRLYTKQTI